MGGMVVAPQVPAVEAGVRVLKAGGNAFDAAVTASFVQMIADPQMCGVAGFGVAGTAGSKVTADMWADIVIEQDWTGYGYHLKGAPNDIGYTSIMTPGTVAGMAAVLERFGTISWADALQPAIDLAEAGVVVTPELWRLWNTPAGMLYMSMIPRLQVTDACRKIFFNSEGRTWNPGERMYNPDYAATLRRLAEAGPQDFYTGQIAALMAEDLEANGSFITADDLAAYRPEIFDPIVIDYRGYRVVTNPPAGGGVCVAQILKIVEHEDIAALGHNTVDYIELVAYAMKAAYHDWYAYVGDSRFAEVPVEWLTSQERADEWYGRIKQRDQFSVPRYPESPNTTNITVVDDAGNCIAMTHSLGSSSGVVTPGLGFTYNNIMNTANPVPGFPNSIAPGKSRITGMCPTVVHRDGEPVLVLGAPGGTRIITGVTQVILNVLDHNMSPVEAVSAPRFDCQSNILDAEARIPSWVRDELGQRGFDMFPSIAPYGPFALVQAITRNPETGKLSGGADPRSGGAVMQS
ncbi:MAG: gamma-glutamyltransferase [Chloroflexi bacterium]|nr:MAG: gamma-glutamyltransferase [Chloroflexota bacterium]